MHTRVVGVTYSPLLPHKADVELAALQVFTGVAHDLVEGIFQQVVTTDDQPEKHTRVNTQKQKREAALFRETQSTYFSFPGPWP